MLRCLPIASRLAPQNPAEGRGRARHGLGILCPEWQRAELWPQRVGLLGTMHVTLFGPRVCADKIKLRMKIRSSKITMVPNFGDEGP